MNYSIYNPETGEIVSNFGTNDPTQVEANLAGKSYIEGTWDGRKFKVVDGQPVALPDPTPAPPTAQQIRVIRDGRLSDVDRVNPIWYNSLTSEQQTELAEYRQALLDVPAQTGFPASVVWPTKPAWL